MGFSPLCRYKQEIVGEKLGANETAILGPTIATLPRETVVAIVFPVIVICTITVVLV